MPDTLKENLKNLTVEPVRAGNCDNVLPEFGRVEDVRRIFGVKRGILYRWIRENRIKSVLIREPGNKQGIRLIHLQSVREHLFSKMEEQKAFAA